MKKNLILISSLLAFGLAGCSSSPADFNVFRTKKNASGDTHSIYFKGNNIGGASGRNFAQASAGWWGVESCTFASDTVTIPSGSTAYFADSISVASGATYLVSYDLKTDGASSFTFNVNTPTWTNLQNKSSFDSAEYVHYAFLFTPASSDTNSSYYFAVTSGSISVQNLYISATTSISVTEGSAIGTLPEIPAIEGKKGHFEIDGVEINSETLYSYSTDKYASLVYEDVRSITYHNGGAVDLASGLSYWGSGTNLALEDGLLHMKNEDDKVDQAIHNYDVSSADYTSIQNGKKYKISFDIKCDKVNLVLFLHNPWNLLAQEWMEYASFTTLEYTFDSSADLTATFRFRVDTTGNVYIKNLRLYEISTVEYEENKALGELPAIKAQGKYTEGTWQIDGNAISSETIFDYDTLNKDAYVQYIEKYTLTYFGAEDIYTKDLSKDSSLWTKIAGSSTLSSIAREDDALVFKGEAGAMGRFCDPNSFKLVAGETYLLKAKIKTGDSKVHLVVNNDWVNGLLLTHYQAQDYQDLSLEFKAPENQGEKSFLDFQISVAGGEKQFSLKDFYITHITKSNYLAGSSLDALPNVPEGSGWVIDNVPLGKETKYDFGADQTAYLAPTISYEGEEEISYRLGTELKVKGLSANSFYEGGVSYDYAWEDKDGNPMSELNEPGKYFLKVKAKDAKGSFSLNEVKLSVDVLERDTVKPNWVRDGETYVYPNELNITVHEGWIAQLNLEALDEIDGIVEVSYDFGDLVDELGRFKKGSGQVKCLAKDYSGNAIQIIINLTVLE